MRTLAGLVAVSILGLPTILRGADDPVPTMITLKRDAMELHQLLSAVREQTGVAVTVDDSIGNPAVKLAQRELPFWPMIDQIAAATKTRPYLYAGPMKVHLRAQTDASTVPVCYDGIFRTALKQWSITRDFENDSTEYLFAMEVAWQPGFVPLYLHARPRNLILRNDKSTHKSDHVSGSWSSVDGQLATTVNLKLPALEERADVIDLLQGELRVRGASRMTTLEFGSIMQLDALAKPVKPRGKGADNPVQCEVTGITMSRRRWSVTLTVTLPKSAPAFESFQSWTTRNRIYLKNANTGAMLENSGQVENSSTARRVVVEYHFTEPARKNYKPAQWALHYHLPVSMVELPVKFELKNLSLPGKR